MEVKSSWEVWGPGDGAGIMMREAEKNGIRCRLDISSKLITSVDYHFYVFF